MLVQQIIPDVEMPVLDRAADLWIEARAGGHPREDVDLIIASTALVHDLTLVTANTKHFDWIAGLKFDNWREQGRPEQAPRSSGNSSGRR